MESNKNVQEEIDRLRKERSILVGNKKQYEPKEYQRMYNTFSRKIHILENPEYWKNFYQENKESRLELQKDYYQENKEDVIKQRKEYYQKNKDVLTSKQKDYYQKNKDKIVKRQREYYQKNIEVISEKDGLRYIKNKDRYSEYFKKHRLDKWTYYRLLYIKFEESNRGVGTILTENDLTKIIEKFNGECFNCGKIRNLQFDHFYPIRYKIPMSPENCTVLCISCNSAKHQKHPEEFFSKKQLKTLVKDYGIKLQGDLK